MEMRKRAAGKAIAATVLLAICGSAAAEQAPGFYVGALAGQSKTRDMNKGELDALMSFEFGPIASSSVDDSDSGFGVFGGYRFFPWLAVEVAYQDLGEAKYTADIPVFFPNGTVRTEISSEVTAVSGSALFMLPLNDQFSLGARAGIATSKAKFTVRASSQGFSASESDSTTNTSGVFGVNAEWNPTPQLGVRVEFQRFLEVGGDDDEDIDGYDVDLWSAGLLWRF